MKKLIKCLGSFFYLGYIPVIPGTVASAFGLILYLLFRDNIYFYSLLLIVVTGVGFLICGRAEEIFREKDSKRIVIDEVAGMLLAFWAVAPNTTLLIIGFLIFRIFDVLKVYPAGKIERIGGSLGIMGDDLLAGFYTNVILQITTRLI